MILPIGFNFLNIMFFLTINLDNWNVILFPFLIQISNAKVVFYLNNIYYLSLPTFFMLYNNIIIMSYLAIFYRF